MRLIQKAVQITSSQEWPDTPHKQARVIRITAIYHAEISVFICLNLSAAMCKDGLPA
jgi:hypothetical protein